jgi:hypothetical protein
MTFDDKSYINDHLKQEFSDRVSQKRKILLYTKLSIALKHFNIPVTPQEIKEEDAIIQSSIEVQEATHDENTV